MIGWRSLARAGRALRYRAMPAAVARADQARFIEQLRTEFATLHGGNAIRFGLLPLELVAWQRALTKRATSKPRGQRSQNP